MSEVLLELDNLKTYFTVTKGKVKAVDGVSFTLNRGESLGLVGESGCGKTTTALSIIKLLPKEGQIEGGRILFEGKDITHQTEDELSDFRWKQVSMIFQGAMNALNPVKRVCDQVAEPILLHEYTTKKQAMERVKELFELVELDTNLMYSYPHEFSGGMRQRAIIAMALACHPKLIIGDEPTTALDVMVQAQILDLINELRGKLNMSMLMITHDLSIISDTCDKVAIMYAGRIVEMGETKEVLSNSLHPYTKKLISAFPNIYAERKMVDSIPGDPPDLYTPPPGCRFAKRCHMVGGKEVCQVEIHPPLIDYTGKGHYVACHLWRNPDEY